MKPRSAPSTRASLRALALLALTGCGHAHGCGGLSHLPIGRGLGHSASALGHVLSAGRGGGSSGARIGEAAGKLLGGMAVGGRRSFMTSSSGPAYPSEVVLLAEDVEVSAELVATETDAFWVDRGLQDVDSIRATALEGGPVSTLYECAEVGRSTIASLAVGGGYLYWAEAPLAGAELSFVRRMQLGGGAVETLRTERGTIKQVAVSPLFVYSVDESSVIATRLSDRTEATLGKVRASVQGPALAADGWAAYWLGQNEEGTLSVMSAGRPPSPSVSLAPRDATITAMTVAGTTLYWVEDGGPSGLGSVLALDRAGGAPTRLFESNHMSATSAYGHALVAAEGDDVYFAADGSGPDFDGAVYKAGKGRAPRVAVSGYGGPGGVAVTRSWLVFTDMAAGVVARAPR